MQRWDRLATRIERLLCIWSEKRVRMGFVLSSMSVVAVLTILLGLTLNVKARQYQYLTYDDINDRFEQLNKDYPHLVEWYNLQEMYDLPSAGDCGGKECVHYLARITNEKLLTEDTPEVFLSGALHGNERLGPNTVTELASLLVEGYEENDWFKYLLDHRAIYIMPTTNAWGYHHNRREEHNIDPNRDFPYDKGPKCMETVTGRAVNEVWREHLFQLAITFHGGDFVIGYEWGTYDHIKNAHSTEAPDLVAMETLGTQMSEYGGNYGGENYPHLTITDSVYAVNGGMEDWAYAGSWQKTKVNHLQPCNPESARYGPYPEEKTIYNDYQLRAFNYLVEMANRKIPPASELGSSDDVLTPGGKGDGELPRNMRLCLTIIDYVQPYINLAIENKGDYLRATWTVRGAWTVQETQVVVGFVKEVNWTNSSSLTASNPDIVLSSPIVSNTNGNLKFIADLPFKGDGVYVAFARAVVDQTFSKQNHPDPHVPPQSHYVNARTRNDYYAENNGHTIQGQTNWYSPPVAFLHSVEVDPDVLSNIPEMVNLDDMMGPNPGVLPSARPDQESMAHEDDSLLITPKTHQQPKETNDKMKLQYFLMGVVVVLGVVAVILGAKFYKMRRDQRRYQDLEDATTVVDDDDDDSGL
eukprot:GFYU01001856.1.p1 GENE.GFYU01001856.1~~GFYU01001856.1.p1  ORF type:complete len:640 (+),score=121.21 GFYU01001856.1:26-1945(+)